MKGATNTQINTAFQRWFKGQKYIFNFITTFQIAEVTQRFQAPCFTAFEAVAMVTQLTTVMYLTQT